MGELQERIASTKNGSVTSVQAVYAVSYTQLDVYKRQTVYGYASGKISKEGLEDNEDLEVIIADRKEVRRILKEENVSINCGYLLMHFLCHTTEDTFYFLR